MSQKLITRNTFLGGMAQDNLLSLSDKNTYRIARNAVSNNQRHKNFGLTNERSNLKVVNTSDVVGTAYCEERNWTVVFKEDDSLHLFDHNNRSFTKIVSADEFGCSWNFSKCDWIGNNVGFKTMDPCNELHVYFSAGCEYYKINLDLMLDPARKEGLKLELNCDTKCGYRENCEYFKVFKQGCAPKITPKVFDNGGAGGELRAGAYTFVARLKHTDGGETNWFHFSEPVFVGSEHNIAGEPSSSYIEVALSCLDCKFSDMEIAVIENIGGIITAKVLNTVNYGNLNYTIRYNGNDGTPISLVELLGKEHTYLQGKHLEQKDGHMLYYGIKSRKNPHYQPQANQINTEFVVYEIPFEQVKKYNIRGLMRGETYAFSIVLNYIDGSHSHAFHIPSGGGGGSNIQGLSANNSGSSNTGVPSIPTIPSPGEQSGEGQSNLTSNQEVIRTRTAKDDLVSSPQNDHFDDIIQSIVDSMGTTGADTCDEVLLWEQHLKAQCCLCSGGDVICPGDTFTPSYGNSPETFQEGCEICCGSGPECTAGSAYERCIADLNQPESGFGNWGDLIDAYTQDELTPSYSSNTIVSGAQKIAEAIKNRERKERSGKQYNTSKSASYGSGTTQDPNTLGFIPSLTEEERSSSFSGPLFDCCGDNETEVDFKVVSFGPTEVDEETNVKYPCTTTCEGEFIYGNLADQPVRHHKFPTSGLEPHFISKSIGVPHGTYWSDASETSDLYIRVMGVRFSNIQIPDESQLPLPLCPNNPYTIAMVKRTESNKKVLIKGLATGTFRIDNNGKSYDHPRHAVNSREEVSFYHDDGNGGRLSNQGNGDTHMIYSLDGRTVRPSLRADRVLEEQQMFGRGERYGLYAKGKEPDNALTGKRIDALGTRQSINMSGSRGYQNGGLSHTLNFAQYVDGDDSVAPASGGNVPLMNRSGQPGVWIDSSMSQLEDNSFTGDVLDYNVPINDARGQYVSLVRDLADQYGNLENLNYIPILHAGKGNQTTIEGAVGDTYIGPYSFVKTSFVSDKVGECTPGGKFNIPAQVDTKSERRCICDGPEDVVQQANGLWVWTTLPEEGDAADPKNWAGTHTIISSRTMPYSEAEGQDAISDMYFPGTLTTNITYVGEFQTCPWLREKSDLLEKQWYPAIKTPDFKFDSGVTVDGTVAGWEDSYLNQFHRQLEQTSLWQRITKAMLRTSLNVIAPIFGMDSLFDATNGGIDFVSNLVEIPMIFVLWYLMVQVLFTNENLDKLLGIPVCKSDEVGGFKEGYNRGLFFNPSGYNMDYSTVSDLYTYEGVPDPYYTCSCDDCVGSGSNTSNEIYISDRQVQGSLFDAYTHVKPVSKIHIPASYGRLTNLFIESGQLFAHTTDAIIPLRRGRTIIPSDQGEILLGAQGFILEPEGVITEGIPEGFAGLKRHNEHLDSGYGYFFIDSESDIVYQFKSGKLNAISMNQMFNFFKNKLNFCEDSDCIDERVYGKSFYSMGIDPRLNRFMLTKSEVDSDKSFTISYDLEKNTWLSFHDYIPKDYIWDRRTMFTLNDDGIWVHNETESFQQFYGELKPFVIEFVGFNPEIDSFTWEHLVMNTEAVSFKGGSEINDLDITFNKVAFWNSTQGTGTLPIEAVSDNMSEYEDARRLIDEVDTVKANKKRRFWRINEIKDRLLTAFKKEPLTIDDECKAISEINEGIFDSSILNKQNFRNKVVSDKYCVYRFTFDSEDDVELNVINMDTYGNPINDI